MPTPARPDDAPAPDRPLSAERRAAIAAMLAAITGNGDWHTTTYAGGLRFGGPVRAYCGTNEEYGEPRSMPETDADHRFVAAAPAIVHELLAAHDAAVARADAAMDALNDAAFALHCAADYWPRGQMEGARQDVRDAYARAGVVLDSDENASRRWLERRGWDMKGDAE